MSQKLYGPLDEIYALARGADASGSSDSLFGARDSELLERILERFLDDPVHASNFRTLLDESLEGGWDRAALKRELALRISRGDIVVRYLRDARNDQQLPGETVSAAGDIIDVEGSGREQEELVIDWKITCSHHPSARPIFERDDFIQLVPDKGTLTDVVTVHYKNERTPPPPALRANGEEWPKTGSDGGYDTYDVELAYDIGEEITTFILPSFWANWQSKTVHSIYDGPTLMHAEVFNPRQYKFEMSLPAAKSFAGGYRLEKDVKVEGGKINVADDYNFTFREDDATASGWGPSNLAVNKEVRRESGNPLGDESRSTPAAVSGIKYSIDGSEVSLSFIELVGTILNLQAQVTDIIEAIQSNAPKVGWYAELNFQLLQGSFAIEWYWKEHSDHRVFRYFDASISLTLVSITFELGVGLSGLGFRAQIFASLSGEVKVSLSACRDDPDALPGISVPAVGTITGALGARFEVGNLFKADGRGETGIEIRSELGINKRASKGFHIDINSTKWTGITVKATYSAGFIWRRQRTWTKQICGEKNMGGFRFPEPKEYRPPYLAKGAIKSKMQSVITAGWNVNVTREVEGWFNDVSWTSSEIAQALADRVDEHRTWRRTPRCVDGLAHSIRGDLDRLGRNLSERQFQAYLRGGTIQAHLDKLIDPATDLANRAG